MTQEAIDKQPRSKRGFHWGYLIVAAFALTSFGPLSLGLSCAGLFFTPIANDLGTQPGTMSYYISMVGLAAILTLSLWSKLVEKLDIRLFATIAVALIAGGLIVESFATAAWQYLTCGLVAGCGITALLYVAPSTVINRWFAVKPGVYLGLVMAFTGVGGVVWNLVGGALIQDFGWRFALRAFAALTLVIGLVAALLLLRSRPSDLGLTPVGSDAAPVGSPSQKADPLPGIAASAVWRRRSFPMLMAFALLLNFGMYVYQMIASYCATLDLSATMPLLGATAASVAMASQTISKVVLGWAGEKDTLISIVTAVILGITGVLVLAFFASSAAMVYVGAAAYGVYYALTNVMLPILTRKFYGVREYSAIYARVSLAANAGSVLAAFAWGTLVSVTGSYTPMFLGVVTVLGLAGYASIVAITIVRKNLSRVIDEQNGVPVEGEPVLH